MDFACTSVVVLDMGCLTATVEVEAGCRFPFLLLYWLPDWELHLIKVKRLGQVVATMSHHGLGHAEVLVQFVVFYGLLFVLRFLDRAHEVPLDGTLLVPASAVG